MNNNTKLDRSLSPLNVWSLALGSIIGWGAFVMPGNLFLKTAGPLGSAIGMMIGSLIMIIIAISYGYLIQKFPVAGGEFVFAFKGFGRTHAFICAWFLGLSYLSIVPLNATALGLIGRYMFPGILQVGYLYTIAGWEVYLGEVLFASLSLIIFAITSIKGIKISGNIQTFMAFALVGSILLLTVVALFSNQTSIKNLTPAFSPENTPIGGILAVVAIAPWAFVGFDTIPQASEEMNFSTKKAMGIMILSILLGGLMYIAMNTVTAIVYPWNEFIETGPFWATGEAVEQLMGQIGLFVLGIALISAILAGIIGFYMATSRLLLSMARAKALPEWFSVVDSKNKTPKNAILFVLLISLITPWFGRQVLLWVVDMASIGAAIGYFYTTASAFNILRKTKGKRIQIAVSFIGSILSLGFIILLIVPGMPAYLSFPSRIALFIWILLGIIFYVVSAKSYNKLTTQELSKLIINEE
ncbi:APC family permease [Facklamia sp. P12945]|uniref:APC family permease n=1 Tax=Facklamia sp. P12945 TaxID=3421950 RepID=UPI003D172665